MRRLYPILAFCGIINFFSPALAQGLNQQINYCNNHDGRFSAETAIAGCTAVIESGRKEDRILAIAYLDRGVAYSDKGDSDLAISDFDRAIQLNPQYDHAYYDRARAYAKKGEFDRAIADYDRAIEINPGFVEAYTSRGFRYFVKNDYERAFADYDQALRMRPDNAKILLYRGLSLVKIGRRAEGEADIAKAKQIDPSVSL